MRDRWMLDLKCGHEFGEKKIKDVNFNDIYNAVKMASILKNNKQIKELSKEIYEKSKNKFMEK